MFTTLKICGIKPLRVTIFFEEEFLGVYPSLINSISLFSQTDSTTHVISTSRKSNFPSPPPFSNNVFFHKILQHSDYDRNQFILEKNAPTTQIRDNRKSNPWKQFLPESLKVQYRQLRNLWIENRDQWKEQKEWIFEKIRYYFFCLRKAWSIKPNVLVSVDESGLIAASLYRLICIKKPKLIFWSLEIDTGKSNLLFNYLHQKIFSIFVKQVDVVVIQEKTRLVTLEAQLKYRFDHAKIFFIPHSPLDNDSLSPVATGQKRFFQDLFTLSSNDKVILHGGWIHDAMCVDKFAKASKSWRDEYKLVLHEREKRSPEENFIRYVSELSEGKVLLSLEPVSFDRMDEVFSSAHVGLIAYDKKYGGGRENAHKASGKLGQYLKCGIPVVALDLPGYKEMFEEYKCGLVFNDFGQIEKCIETILDDYDTYCKESIRCFQEEFDFKRYFNPFLNYLLAAQ